MRYEQVYGIFSNAEYAERAISALKDHGVRDDEISVVRRSDGKGLPEIEEGGSRGITVTTPQDATAGALKGGAVGIALGVLAGAVMLTVPGVGPILAAGPLWAAFGAAAATGAAGAALGGVVGYLVDQGVPADRANIYAGAISRGDTLVSVNSRHEPAGEAMILLEKYGATEIARHNVGDPADPAEPVITELTPPEPVQIVAEANVTPAAPPTPEMQHLPTV